MKRWTQATTGAVCASIAVGGLLSLGASANAVPTATAKPRHVEAIQRGGAAPGGKESDDIAQQMMERCRQMMDSMGSMEGMMGARPR